MATTPKPSLASRLEELRGIGRERAVQLARLQLFTVGDLLLCRPRRYEDRRHFIDIARMQLGEPATLRGQVVALGLKRFRKGTKSVFELIVEDGTARLHCRWWNLPFMEKYFQRGDEVFVFGKPVALKPRTIDHPEIEVIEAGEDSSIHLNRITPVYPLTEGLPQRWLRGLIWRTLAQFESEITERWPNVDLSDWPTRLQAVRDLHFPQEMNQADKARERLALDEFIDLQIAIQRRRKNLQAQARGLPCGGDNRLIKPFLKRLGFSLTGAQTRVLRELRHDLSGPFPMRRLLQGDVGSGKTVVAACCVLMALESGFNAALMAPTEILAEQHFQTFCRWLEPLGIKVHLQTGSRKTSAPDTVESQSAVRVSVLHAPRSALFIGTHALIQSSLELANLGLVIIDEQHKFGVAQREKFVRKGHYPHLLVMTATPIPRTLGLTLYGDLDVSIIDELPGGRGQIKTFVRMADKLPKVWEFIRQKLAAGRQGYIVYPRVEDSSPGNVKAVTQEWERLQQILAPFRLGLLHGRLKSQKRKWSWSSFVAARSTSCWPHRLSRLGLTCRTPRSC